MPYYVFRRLKWLLVLAVLVTACDSSPGGLPAPPPEDDGEEFSDELPDWPVRLSDDWTVVKPETAGVRQTHLGEASLWALRIERLRSLVVVKDGAIIMEKYFNGAQPDDLFDVRSVTKSIVSSLVAIALGSGQIPNLDTPIGDNLGSLMDEMPDENREVTFRDLLTMSGGWQYNEWSGTSFGDWLTSGETERWVLMQPRLHEPGTHFTYNSAAVHLLGVLTQQFVPGTLIDYADAELFQPLGITRRRWEMLGSGYPNGGAGIDLTARDLARIGQLYLQDGWSGDERILPEGWVTEATTPHWEWRSTFQPLEEMSYGYLWWTDDNGGDPVFFAWGWGGQFVYVKPSSRLVVVTTTNWSGVDSEPGGESALAHEAMYLIHDHVVPAVDRED